MSGHTMWNESDLQAHLEDEFPVVLIEEDDESIHSTTGFCVDPTCPCHEDPDLIGEVNQMYQEGLLTDQEAKDLVAGKTI